MLASSVTGRHVTHAPPSASRASPGLRPCLVEVRNGEQFTDAGQVEQPPHAPRRSGNDESSIASGETTGGGDEHHQPSRIDERHLGKIERHGAPLVSIASANLPATTGRADMSNSPPTATVTPSPLGRTPHLT